MLTDDDMNKLEERFKKIFVTKTDLIEMEKRFDKKYATKEDLKQFATKNDLKQFVTKDDLGNVTNELIKLVTDGFSTILDRIDDLQVESKNNRIVLGDHEKRLQRIEYRSSRSTT